MEQRSDRGTQEIDKVIRWCMAIFGLSSVAMIVLTVYALKQDQFALYLLVTGIVYLVLSTLFLGVISWVFLKGHVGHSQTIENPKMEIFELEDSL